MSLSPDDLAAMNERHFPIWDSFEAPTQQVCLEDQQGWPCDSRRLLDEVEAMREALDMHIGVEKVLLDRVVELEEVMTQTANEPST